MTTMPPGGNQNDVQGRTRVTPTGTTLRVVQGFSVAPSVPEMKLFSSNTCPNAGPDYLVGNQCNPDALTTYGYCGLCWQLTRLMEQIGQLSKEDAAFVLAYAPTDDTPPRIPKAWITRVTAHMDKTFPHLKQAIEQGLRRDMGEESPCT